MEEKKSGNCRTVFRDFRDYSLRMSRGGALHNIRVRYPLSAVGAVYDRAIGPLACESCAVIDRAYSKNDDVTSRCAKPPRMYLSL